MIRLKEANPEFHDGEEIVLAGGPYTGTPGVFLHLREDPNWADIAERNDTIRRHPVAWLAHSPAAPKERTAA